MSADVNTDVSEAGGLITPVGKQEGKTYDLDSVAGRLAHARSLKEWSQAKLAKEAGLESTGTVGNIEAGRGPGLPSLPRLAKALGVRLEWLRDGEEPMREPPPKDAWPFKTVERSRFDALDDDQKAQVEGRLHSAIYACEIADQTPELSRQLVRLLTFLDSITSPLDRLIAVETALAALGQGKKQFEPKQAPAKAPRRHAASGHK